MKIITEIFFLLFAFGVIAVLVSLTLYFIVSIFLKVFYYLKNKKGEKK